MLLVHFFINDLASQNSLLLHFSAPQAAERAVRDTVARTIEAQIAALRGSGIGDDAAMPTSVTTVDGMNAMLESVVKSLNAKPAYAELSLRSIAAEESLRARQQELAQLQLQQQQSKH